MADDPRDVVWDDVWNPTVNRWSPSDEPYPGYDVDVLTEYQSHGDVATTSPESEQYRRPDRGGGSVPDARANLLTDVADAGTTAPPVSVVRHELVTSEAGGEVVRARTVVVTGNLAPTRLLDENPDRKRALIKVVTTASVVLIGPAFGGMGSPQLTGVPTQPVGAWLQATGDPVLEIKAQAAVDVVGVVAAPASVLVTVWEEINAESNQPGLTGN